MNRRDYCQASLAVLSQVMFAKAGFGGATREDEALSERPFTLRFSITLTNHHGHELLDQTFWFHAPAETPGQKLESVSATIPHEVESDFFGQRIVKLQIKPVPPLATRVVNISFNVVIRSVSNRTSLPRPADWMKSESGISVDDPETRALASGLRRSSDLGTGEAIFDWLRSNLRSTGYRADRGDAQAALHRGGGDCSDYAYLAVALARANGIPARAVGGYAIDGSALLRAVDYHDWAELFIDGAWQLLDAQRGYWRTARTAFVAFHFYHESGVFSSTKDSRYKTIGELDITY